MDFANSTRAAEKRTRWERIVAKSTMVPERSCKFMGYIRLSKPDDKKQFRKVEYILVYMSKLLIAFRYTKSFC